MSEPDAGVSTGAASGDSSGDSSGVSSADSTAVSELTGLDQSALERAGGPMAELTDTALYAEIESNRRAEFRLVASAGISLLAIAVLLVARWLYLG